MAPQLAAAISLSSSSPASPACRRVASTVPRHHPFAASHVSLVRPSDGLVAVRPSGSSSTSAPSGCRGAPTVVCQAALFQFLNLNKGKDKELVKGKLLTEIAKLDRGADATPEDKERIDKIVRELEALNPTKEPLKSPLINGKWLLVYTTSESILKTKRQKFLRPNGPIYQAINAGTLRAQNLESWPFFNQVTANLDPVSPKKVVVNFDFFKIGGLIKVKAPGRARGELEITYVDDDLRISRGDKGNLFILTMVDPEYKVPLES